jgi:hypothetical protein
MIRADTLVQVEVGVVELALRGSLHSHHGHHLLGGDYTLTPCKFKGFGQQALKT